ncbi:cation diffusion facilitator family transporter [Litorimonas cladophorae]|uniref:cation diffusion facilitator family transporter n=1 Tax=Litorimonas cladophorae TaxID=1220491 RepID=UPI00167597E9|nr:cation diffusion facilitator family transporter [Litorimonas cladophorae]
MASHSHHDHGADHHDHNHEHGHSHAPKVNESNRRRVGLAALLTGIFMIVEVAGGLISGSLALLADAGHMMTDFAALAMAWGAFKIAQRPANWRHTFGYDRVSILVAFVNGLTLFGVAVWIIWEGIHRFLEPTDVLAGPMLWVAIAGLIVNLIVFWVLMGADQHNLNIRGAVLHVLGDLLGSVAAIAAAVIILTTGWVLADPILSILVAVLILRSAWALVKDSAHVLLQGAPSNLDRREIETDLLMNVPDLLRVDHIHAWAVTPERPIVTLNAYIAPSARVEPVAQAIKARLAEKFDIDHATVDVMREG